MQPTGGDLGAILTLTQMSPNPLTLALTGAKLNEPEPNSLFPNLDIR